MKFCKYCQRNLPLSEFPVRRASPDGLSYKCRECGNQYNMTRYEGNAAVRAAAKDRARRWAAENRERRREIARASQAKHADTHNARARERNRRNRQMRPEHYRLVGRIAANKRRTAGVMPPREVIAMILSMARGRCVYCGRIAKLTLDHITPIRSGGTNDWDNFVPCCKPCNCSKNAADAADWLYRKHGVVGLANTFLFMKAVKKAICRLHPHIVIKEV